MAWSRSLCAFSMAWRGLRNVGLAEHAAPVALGPSPMGRVKSFCSRSLVRRGARLARRASLHSDQKGEAYSARRRPGAWL